VSIDSYSNHLTLGWRCSRGLFRVCQAANDSLFAAAWFQTCLTRLDVDYVDRDAREFTGASAKGFSGAKYAVAAWLALSHHAGSILAGRRCAPPCLRHSQDLAGVWICLLAGTNSKCRIALPAGSPIRGASKSRSLSLVLRYFQSGAPSMCGR